jgi:hypothetical protein
MKQCKILSNSPLFGFKPVISRLLGVRFIAPMVKYIRHYVKYTIQSGEFYRTTREVKTANKKKWIATPQWICQER